jgi:glyoxylase-like metal-dependent hydrolase (beta-lactamase superfamily II)
VRAVGVHEDVLVVTSQIWAASATALRAGGEGFLVDCPVLPGELEALPALLEQAGFPVTGLLATHADWDHVLGRLAFPQAALGVGETTAARLRAEPGDAQRELRAFDETWYVKRPGPLSLGDVQALPLPGHVELGAQEIELHPADGHTDDGMALWAAWAGVLCAGDYLSPVEIPMLSEGGSLDAYLATLRRLRPLVEAAETVVPGHGGPIGGEHALRILAEDEAYLETLRDRGAETPLPEGRRTAEQRRIHAENAQSLSK